MNIFDMIYQSALHFAVGVPAALVFPRAEARKITENVMDPLTIWNADAHASKMTPPKLSWSAWIGRALIILCLLGASAAIAASPLWSA